MLKKILAVMLILFLTVPLFVTTVSADAGNFSADHDYGNHSGSSSDDDDDDGGILAWLIELLFRLLIDMIAAGNYKGAMIIGFIILFLIAVVLIRKARRKAYYKKNPVNKDNASNSYRDTGTAVRPSSFDRYKEIDPGFDEAKFKAKMSNIFIQMQNCLDAKDPEPIRPHVTDELYSQLEAKVRKNVSEGLTDHTEGISVHNVRINGFKQSGGYDVIKVVLNTRFITYTTEDSTGKTVKGSETEEKFTNYEWDVIRKAGKKTDESGHDGLGRSVCPFCGAPVNINASTRCEYCDSILSDPENEWRVNCIVMLSQR